MRSPRFLGHVLGIYLPVVATLAALPVPASAPQHAASTPTSNVTIRHREAAQYKLSGRSYPVTEVRQVLEHGLAAAGLPALDSRTARVTLARAYGGRLSESSVPMGYAWVWDPVLHRWVFVCASVSTFQVDFGSRGTVEVEVRESEPVP